MLVMQEGDSLFGGLPIIHITYQQYIANPSAYHDPDVIVHISGYPTAGNLPADYVGYDSNLNMEDIGNIATKAIAKVEPSDTALYLHPVGSYFINKDGNSCKTDVQISVGGTITLGTNCHVVDGVANDINSKLVNIEVSTLYSCTLSELSDALGGYYGEITLTDVPTNCFLIIPMGGARNSWDGGRYGIVGNYFPTNPTSTRWFINGAQARTYQICFVYFCRNN